MGTWPFCARIVSYEYTEAGIEIQDHTGDPWDHRRSIKAIAYQPTAGLQREVVIETLRPTVYYKTSHIQMGEVIVGTPEAEGHADA